VEGIEPLQLAIMPRLRGGGDLDAELRRLAADGMLHLVSLLEYEEMQDVGLAQESELCDRHGIRFHRYPIRDHGTPEDMDDFVRFVDTLVGPARSGEAIGIHCMAGIGRSGLTAGCLMLRCGQPLRGIFPQLSRARGLGVPETTEQALWFREFARLHAPAR
jgi:hypothetical protein